MAVIIRNMEMPKCCKECKFCSVEYGDWPGDTDVLTCNILFYLDLFNASENVGPNDDYSNYIRPNCPLVNVVEETDNHWVKKE